MDLDTGMLEKVVEQKRVQEVVCIVIEMMVVFITVVGTVPTQMVKANYVTETLV